MILDTLKDCICRYTTEDEIEAVYAVLEPLVCDESDADNVYSMTQRKLRKYLKYAIKTQQCLVVCRDGVVTSVYAGDRDTIMYMGTAGTDVVSTCLIMNTVLNKVHNRFTESKFLTVNEKQRRAWNVSALGDVAVEISSDGIGKVKLIAKERIERLYSALKDNV